MRLIVCMPRPRKENVTCERRLSLLQSKKSQVPCVPVASILKSYVNLTLGWAPIFLKSMALKKHLLVSPGPTPVPPQVSLSGAAPIIHHRTPQFQAIMKEVAENLKYLFCTKN